jgi:hypothetical protein
MFNDCVSLVGAIAYNSSNRNDKTYANYETGYLTYKTNIRIGDYFSMTPDSNTYTISISETGHSTNQTIQPSELTLWRVINIQNDGKIEAVSEYTSTTIVTFASTTGYTNIIGGLQTIATQYSKSGYTYSTRNFGYDGQTLVILNTSSYDGTATKPTAPSTTTTPTPTTGTGTEYGDGLLGDTLYLRDYLLVKNVYGNLIAYKKGTNTEAEYWLSSRQYIYDELSLTFSFNGRRIDTNGDIVFNGFRQYLGGTSFMDGSGNFYIRPIITLNSNIRTNGGNGKKSNPYTLTN